MKIKSVILWLSVIAAFSLAYWPSTPGKIGDTLFVIIGASLALNKETRSEIKNLWPKLKPYIWCFFAIVAFTAIAQAISYTNGENAIDREAIANYLRMAFNGYVFFLSAFLVYRYGRKYLVPASWAIFLSPLIVLPVYWNLHEGSHYLESWRLTGFLQSSIMFGLWTTVTFALGTAIFITHEKTWQRMLVAGELTILAAFDIWTTSRAAWLSLALAMALFAAFYIFREKNFAKAALVAIIFVLTLSVGYQIVPSQGFLRQTATRRAKNFTSSIVQFAPSKIESQNQTRVWPIALKFISRNPLGVGFGSYASRGIAAAGGLGDSQIVASNSFMEVVLYGGFGALIAFLAILAGLGRNVWTMTASRDFLGTQRGLHDLKLAWCIAATALILDIFFTYGFLWRHTWFVLGTVLGVCLLSISDHTLAASSKNA